MRPVDPTVINTLKALARFLDHATVTPGDTTVDGSYHELARHVREMQKRDLPRDPAHTHDAYELAVCNLVSFKNHLRNL